MRKMLFSLLIAAAMLACLTSCENEALPGGAASGQLTLSVVTWDIAAGDIQLDLKGSTNQSVYTVTFYVFGSDDDLGDGGMVPLGHQRLAEQGFGPIAMGEQLLDVDLSPWDAFAHIYVYNAGTSYTSTRRLSPGKRYEFQAIVIP